ncbi:DUF3108 domain-containing protein [bacterium]|nr:DUF3108 domain-containing protein [bacterium]
MNRPVYRRFVLVVVCFLVAVYAVGQDSSSSPADSFVNTPPPVTTTTMEEVRQALGSMPAAPDTIPFGVGERLRYHMDFSFVQAGLSEMAILGVDSINGRQAFHFRSRVRSTRTIDIIYKVRDVVESWFDTERVFAHRYERRIREGGYTNLKFYDYNHETGWVSISNEFGPKGLTPFKPFSHNVISALYWVRTQDLTEGAELIVPLHDMDVQYPLVVKVYGREKVTVPAGTFICWKVEPVIVSEGLFKMAGRLVVWISDDEHRLPVMMSSKIPVGNIDGKLVDYRLGAAVGEETPPITIPTDDSWDW